MLGKKSAIALSVLGVILSSTGAYAHKTNTNYTSAPQVQIPAPVVSNNNLMVTIPNLRQGFELSYSNIALKPAASNLNYVILNKELPAQSPSWTERELMPGYSYAFELGGRYIICEGRDINLTWTHMNNSTTSSVRAGSEYFLGPDYEIGPDGLPITLAQGKAQFKYDVINLDAGQYVKFGQHVSVRFFGGLSEGILKEQVNSTYTGSTVGAFAGPFSSFQSVTANFTGIGPRFGMSGSYDTESGFGLIGEAGLSALIGSSYSKTNYTSSGAELAALYNGQTNNKQLIRDQSITQVVPGFDAKLGLRYRHAFCNGSLFTIGAGYQAAVYVNAINQYLPGSLVDSSDITALESGGIFVATMNHTQSNYSVQGPFLSASLAL